MINPYPWYILKAMTMNLYVYLNGRRMHAVSLVEAEVSKFHHNRTEPNAHTDYMPPAY